jgi:hypothetical protein
LPGAAKLGFSGSAAAQVYVDIDYFYDELDPYGEWVWHPRYGYVWLPGAVREDWRPYTMGHWIYTDQYGWYWDSYEPFAWAVYHYGRWGYDPGYGWFWVPGDSWAPAWVVWRYSDEYVGWSPIGPGFGGYAYGVPVSYGPPVVESWVFVQPRYLTSRSIYYYALPVINLNIAFLSATTLYRPEFRGDIIYNRGIPREQVVRITNSPIIVQNIYKTTQKGDRYDRVEGRAKGIQVFAPALSKNAKPSRPPKRFTDNPSEFKATAKLKNTIKGPPPKGWGPSAATIKPVTEEVGPGGFKKKKPSGSIGPAGPGGKPKAYNVPSQEATGGPPFEGGPSGPNKRKKQGGPGAPIGPGASPGGPNAYDVPSQEATGGPPFQGGPNGPGKRRKQGGPGGPGAPTGPGAPGGPNAYDVPGQEATGGPSFQGGPNGPGKRRKQGGPGAPIGPGASPGGPNASGGPGQGALKQSGTSGGPAGEQGGKSKHGKPPCKQNPDLPGCKDDQ